MQKLRYNIQMMKTFVQLNTFENLNLEKLSRRLKAKIPESKILGNLMLLSDYGGFHCEFVLVMFWYFQTRINAKQQFNIIIALTSHLEFPNMGNTYPVNVNELEQCKIILRY